MRIGRKGIHATLGTRLLSATTRRNVRRLYISEMCLNVQKKMLLKTKASRAICTLYHSRKRQLAAVEVLDVNHYNITWCNYDLYDSETEILAPLRGNVALDILHRYLQPMFLKIRTQLPGEEVTSDDLRRIDFFEVFHSITWRMSCYTCEKWSIFSSEIDMKPFWPKVIASSITNRLCVS